ncbi:DUF3040 domain-containing protein [Bounagaea algeriensis]
MLSRREWERLAEIESALHAEDPDLVERFEALSGEGTGEPLGLPVLFGLVAVLVVLALSSLVAGMAVVAVPVGVLAVAVALAGALTTGHRR